MLLIDATNGAEPWIEVTGIGRAAVARLSEYNPSFDIDGKRQFFHNTAPKNPCAGT